MSKESKVLLLKCSGAKKSLSSRMKTVTLTTALLQLYEIV